MVIIYPMALLNRDTIRYLTELSRIACTDEEQESLLVDMQKILSYIEKLSEIDTEGVTPCNHVLEEIVNVMREDVTGDTLSREEFLANAPDKTGGYIRVPTVIKKS